MSHTSWFQIPNRRIDVSIVLGEIPLLSFVTTTNGTRHALSLQPVSTTGQWSLPLADVPTTYQQRTNTPPAAFIWQSTPPIFDLHIRADSFVRNAIQCQIRGPFGCFNAHLLRGRQAYQGADVTCHLGDEMRGRSAAIERKKMTCHMDYISRRKASLLAHSIHPLLRSRYSTVIRSGRARNVVKPWKRAAIFSQGCSIRNLRNFERLCCREFRP
ncbi:hypothetical protein BDP81DRAFT_13012 [Colletotrichum phormii]|uniref:Uncharacterized protein n=1 Tax=Colletotrichum phormii TaxID=359342 RepID=A0AAJ0A3T9_9PEZI|nr:uncharacterized protein BDP81DRAFT_13012 [Colletotrichum phormii]KAK1655956.1 hypothetical protein BDP81DRAFT_13012 [Colletotrichum phormii]